MTWFDYDKNICVIPLVVALVACGDDVSGSDGAGTGDGTTTGEVGTTDGDTGSTSADTTSATGSTGATSGTGDSSSGSDSGTTTGAAGVCEPAPGLEDALYPLQVGRTWSFSLLCSCDWDGNVETRTVTGTQMIGGREAFVLETDFGAGPSPSYWTVDGQAVDRWNESAQAWERLIEVPIEEGYEWGTFDKYHWEPVGEVTVDAGTFSDCWKVVGCQQVNMCYSEWTYCPGIGPVAEQGFESSRELLGCDPPT